MNTQEYIEQTVGRLGDEGNEIIRIQFENGPVTVGFRSVFRSRWLTNFDLFTVLADCPEAGEASLSRLATQSLEYALRNRSQLLGMRNSTALTVFPVLVAGSVNAGAKANALARPPKLVGAFLFPAIIDLAANEIYSFTGKVVWGSLYVKWQRERLSSAVQPPISSGY